jgi:signal transduction histidine kinase
MIKGDPEALWKVITVLLDNAIKYSSRDSKITIKLYDLPQEIQVSVMDEGIGIQQEYLSKIFDEFFIIPSETEYARMDGRTGLGLFIARGMVQGHGGKMWVESVYGLGSTFHFTLPKNL